MFSPNQNYPCMAQQKKRDANHILIPQVIFYFMSVPKLWSFWYRYDVTDHLWNQNMICVFFVVVVAVTGVYQFLSVAWHGVSRTHILDLRIACFPPALFYVRKHSNRTTRPDPPQIPEGVHQCWLIAECMLVLCKLVCMCTTHGLM